MNMKKFLPLVILGVLLSGAAVILHNSPTAERRGPPGFKVRVDAMAVRSAPYQVSLQSYGTVQPRTQSILVAQVSGEVTAINPNFREGSSFAEGDLLLSIDVRDYEADVRIAEGSLMESHQVLAEEEARSEQARKDWERLGNEGEAPALVLRKPQLLAAKARVISAESVLQKAKLDLERTGIYAPYDGRILRQLVDVGQVVSVNTRLAEIYASDYVEIRLPLRNRDLGLIDLPESSNRLIDKSRDNVTIYSDLGGEQRWSARIVRTEGAIDALARQLHVVAQIDEPFRIDGIHVLPLKIGQYVTAELRGRRLDDAIVIPNATIYQGSYVYTVKDDVLQRKDIDIAWQNDTEALIEGGLNDGDQLVTTLLGQVVSGTPVSVSVRPGEEGARLSSEENTDEIDGPRADRS